MDDVYYTVEDLAARLTIAPATLRHWRAHGRGPRATKLGRRVVFAGRDVDRWIQEQQARDTKTPA